MKLEGFAPTSLRDTTTTTVKNVPLLPMSGMADTFACIPVCLYVYNVANDEWEPMTQP